MTRPSARRPDAGGQHGPLKANGLDFDDVIDLLASTLDDLSIETGLDRLALAEGLARRVRESSPDTVEEFEFGFAASPETIARAEKMITPLRYSPEILKILAQRPAPDKAPALWHDRIHDPELAKLDAARFVRTIYAPWLGKGLTRRHLHDIDAALYKALSVWESRHPGDRIDELPTLAEVIDRKVEALSAIMPEEELRKIASTLQARHQRSKN